MRRWRVPVFPFDRVIARGIAHQTAPAVERPLRLATLLADERLLLVLAIGIWVPAQSGPRRQRSAARHVLLSVLLSSVVPHILKRCFAQERPDRIEVRRRRRGIPRSGKALDSFPSGHAVQMGALAAALARIWPRYSVWSWSGATLIALTRVALLAHWPSDVVAGGALGVGVEHLVNSLERGES
ncbi:phosphatase PAP2 family protein [Bosea sp. 2RAB26]|uniref:phosphatase PAP2 family protein n=1 Tax=Bosea sp. 2RAB26 TaxID=3237476 RepID=UPI003F92758E